MRMSAWVFFSCGVVVGFVSSKLLNGSMRSSSGAPIFLFSFPFCSAAAAALLVRVVLPPSLGLPIILRYLSVLHATLLA
jgi:hypothetical protein